MEIGCSADSSEPTSSAASNILVDESRRTFLRAAGLLVAGLVLPQARADQSSPSTSASENKVILVVIGGVRRAESFSREGLENIPHLTQDLLPRSLFYAHARNDGVTAHFNAISSILTGNWQRVDDWETRSHHPHPVRTIPQGSTH